jgi:hypothetical protein
MVSGCASTAPMTSDQESALRTQTFDFLCKGGQQRRKIEASWTAKVDSFAGEPLDQVMEKQAAQRAEFQRDAKAKFGRLNRRYDLDQVKSYIGGGKLDEANLATYLANEFVLMVPQRQHIDIYEEGCLPQYADNNQFLGYMDGQPVISTLLKNRNSIWGCYAMKNTRVLQNDDRFTTRLDLNGFCKYARPADSLVAR